MTVLNFSDNFTVIAIMLIFSNFISIFYKIIMKELYYKTLSVFRSIRSKIVFYPTGFAVGGILFAFLMMYIENQGVSKYLLDKLPVLVVDNGDTALAILSAIITGLISMMVFSFSMVMLLLNQASSNYSPRLL